ncbi:MAG: hypothetical protein AAFW89_02135 [Bacteroidota bacterium]
MTGVELLGWVGFGILVAAWIPQTMDTIKTGKAAMNMAFIIMYTSSSLLLTVYSILQGDVVFIALNGMLTLGSSINLFYALFPRKKDSDD